MCVNSCLPLELQGDSRRLGGPAKLILKLIKGEKKLGVAWWRRGVVVRVDVPCSVSFQVLVLQWLRMRGTTAPV